MSNLKLRKGVFSLIGLLAAITWSAIILLIGHPNNLGACGWLSYVFVLVSIAVAVACFSFHRTPQNDSSLVGIPFYYSIAFVSISVIINGIYILAEIKSLGVLAIAVDIVLFVAYLGIMVFSYLYQERFLKRIENVETRTTFVTSCSAAIGVLLSESADPDIHNALVKLKEKVDFSSNITKSPALISEISEKVSEIRAAIESSDEKADILKLIEELGNLWNKKNAIQK